MNIDMSNVYKPYLIVLQLDNIQEFIISLFEKSEDSKSLAIVQNNSNIIEYMSALSTSECSIDKVYKEYKEYNYFEKIVGKNYLTSIVAISGKVILEVSEENLNEIEKNIIDNYEDMIKSKIGLIYLKNKITTSKRKCYDELTVKLSSSSKYTEIYSLLSNRTNTESNWITPAEIPMVEKQTTRQILETYRTRNKNQIMVVKADINNVGSYFKNISCDENLDELKKRSKKFNDCINSFKKKIVLEKKKYFLLYAAGDDLFFIGSIEFLYEIIDSIFNFVRNLNNAFPKNEFTVGVGILTTDYRSPIRYYFSRVDMLMERAKNEAKIKGTNVICLNNQFFYGKAETIDLVSLSTMLKYIKEVEDKEIKSKLHNVLDILKQDTNDTNEQFLSRLNAVYLLTKDERNKLTDFLSSKLLQEEYNNEQFITMLQNILLLIRYKIGLSKGTGEDLKIDSLPLEKIKEKHFSSLLIVEVFEEKLTSLGKYRNWSSEVDILSQIAKGFWFSLNLYLNSKDKLETFLKNYQHENKILFGIYDANEAEIDVKTKLPKRHEEYIVGIVQDIGNKQKEYEQFIRYQIICLNQGGKSNGNK